MKHLAFEDTFGTDDLVTASDSSLAEDHAAFLQADQQLTAGQAAGDAAVQASLTLDQFSEQLAGNPTLSSPVVAAMELTTESICSQLGLSKAFKKEAYKASGEKRLQLVQEGIADRAKDIWLALIRFLERMGDYLAHYVEKFALHLGNYTKESKALATKAKALIAEKGQLTQFDLKEENRKVKLPAVWKGFLQVFADITSYKPFGVAEYIWIGGEGLFTVRYKRMLSDMKTVQMKRHQKASELPNGITRLLSDAAQDSASANKLAERSLDLTQKIFKEADNTYGNIGAIHEGGTLDRRVLEKLKEIGTEPNPRVQLNNLTQLIRKEYAHGGIDLWGHLDVVAPALSLNEISSIDQLMTETVDQAKGIQVQILDFKKFAQQIEASVRKEISHEELQGQFKNFASAISHYLSKLMVNSARAEVNRLLFCVRIATKYSHASLNQYSQVTHKSTASAPASSVNGEKNDEVNKKPIPTNWEAVD